MDLSNQPVRAVPKVRERHGNRKKRKLETYRGVKIPSKKVRGQIDKKNYAKAMENYDYQCAECGTTVGLEMHHVTFRSASGRKGWRNLVPLCKTHHDACHEKFANKDLREMYSGWFADKWRVLHKKRYGDFYGADRFDLYKTGLIDKCTEEAFEEFMSEQEEQHAEQN